MPGSIGMGGVGSARVVDGNVELAFLGQRVERGTVDLHVAVKVVVGDEPLQRSENRGTAHLQLAKLTGVVLGADEDHAGIRRGTREPVREGGYVLWDRDDMSTDGAGVVPLAVNAHDDIGEGDERLLSLGEPTQLFGNLVWKSAVLVAVTRREGGVGEARGTIVLGPIDARPHSARATLGRKI